jgi:hypothetical protein
MRASRRRNKKKGEVEEMESRLFKINTRAVFRG